MSMKPQMLLATVLLLLLPPSISHENMDELRNLERWDQRCLCLIQDMQLKTPSGQQKNKSNIFCETESGEMYLVDFPRLEGQMPDLQSGSTELMLPTNAVVDRDNYEIRVTEMLPQTRPSALFHSRRELAQVEGTLSCLVVRVEASDASTTRSEKELSNSIFGNDQSNPQTINMQSQFKNCSHGKLNFIEADDRNGSFGRNIRNGATTVYVDLPTSGGETLMANAITNALNSVFEVERPPELADHILYCLPPGTMDGVAYAYINSWSSVYNDEWCNMLSSTMHEIGHNLSLGHSNENGRYQDKSGMMGFSYFERSWPLMCFNSAKSWQLGWYNNRHLTISSGSNRSYTGKLASIIDYPDEIGPPMLIKLDAPGEEEYYVNFNFRGSFNSDTQEGGDEVLVVRAGNGIDHSDSELKAKLTAGSTFTISNFENNSDLSVEAISIDTVDGFANVRICLGDCPPECTTDDECNDFDPCTLNLCVKGGCVKTDISTEDCSPETLNPTIFPTLSPTKSSSRKPTNTPSNIPSISGNRPWCGTMKYSLRATICDQISNGAKSCSDPLPFNPTDTLQTLCPQTCGLECNCYDIDSFEHKGKLRDCTWAVNQRKCGKDKFGSYCPKSCDKCPSPLADLLTEAPTRTLTKIPSINPSQTPTKSPTKAPSNKPTMIPTKMPSRMTSSKPTDIIPSSKPSIVRLSRTPSTSVNRPWCGTLNHHKHTKFCKSISKDKARCSDPIISDPDQTVATLCPLTCNLECDCYDVGSFEHKGKLHDCAWAVNQNKCGKDKFDSYCPKSCDKCM